MGKGNGGKKKGKNSSRGKGAYQSIDDGDDQPCKGSKNDKKNRKSKNKSKNGKYHDGNSEGDYDHDNSKLTKILGVDGLEIVEMDADGNCLFRSLSDQLFGDYGKMHYDVRARVCDFMERNKDDFQVFMVFEDEDDDEQDEEDARDFEDYIGNMRQQGEWGGNLEVVAAARMYRRNITVYSETLAALTINHGEARSMGPDLLVSYHENYHYNSVRSKSNPPRPSNKFAQQPSNDQSSDYEQSIDNKQSGVDSLTESLATLPLEDSVPTQKEMKTIKRSAPCPCGSGLRYKKCCLAKQKHATRVERMKAKRREEDDEALLDTSEEKTTSPELFRIVAI